MWGPDNPVRFIEAFVNGRLEYQATTGERQELPQFERKRRTGRCLKSSKFALCCCLATFVLDDIHKFIQCHSKHHRINMNSHSCGTAQAIRRSTKLTLGPI